nr:MAG TPA: hypothetical protein [Caudoviricetes sp.]
MKLKPVISPPFRRHHDNSTHTNRSTKRRRICSPATTRHSAGRISGPAGHSPGMRATRLHRRTDEPLAEHLHSQNDHHRQRQARRSRRTAPLARHRCGVSAMLHSRNTRYGACTPRGYDGGSYTTINTTEGRHEPRTDARISHWHGLVLGRGLRGNQAPHVRWPHPAPNLRRMAQGRHNWGRTPTPSGLHRCSSHHSPRRVQAVVPKSGAEPRLQSTHGFCQPLCDGSRQERLSELSQQTPQESIHAWALLLNSATNFTTSCPSFSSGNGVYAALNCPNRVPVMRTWPSGSKSMTTCATDVTPQAVSESVCATVRTSSARRGRPITSAGNSLSSTARRSHCDREIASASQRLSSQSRSATTHCTALITTLRGRPSERAVALALPLNAWVSANASISGSGIGHLRSDAHHTTHSPWATLVGTCRAQINALQLVFTDFCQVLQTCMGNAVMPPLADAGHADFTKTRNLGGPAKGVDNFGCMKVHASNVRSS